MITVDFPKDVHKIVAHHKIDHDLSTLAEAVIDIVRKHSRRTCQANKGGDCQ